MSDSEGNTMSTFPNSGIEGDKQTTRAAAFATYDPDRSAESLSREEQIAEARMVHDVAYADYAAGCVAAYAARDAYTAAYHTAWATYQTTLARIDMEYPS